MWYVRFAFQWAILPFMFFMEVLDKIVQGLAGYSNPQLQTVSWARIQWRCMWGIFPIEEKIVCENGYLYTKLIYAGRSSILHRL